MRHHGKTWNRPAASATINRTPRFAPPLRIDVMRSLWLALWLILPAFVSAQEWTRFRGPNGTGESESEGIPGSWTAADINWKVALPGVGHSSPVLWGHSTRNSSPGLNISTMGRSGCQRLCVLMVCCSGFLLRSILKTVFAMGLPPWRVPRLSRRSTGSLEAATPAPCPGKLGSPCKRLRRFVGRACKIL